MTKQAKSAHIEWANRHEREAMETWLGYVHEVLANASCEVVLTFKTDDPDRSHIHSVELIQHIPTRKQFFMLFYDHGWDVYIPANTANDSHATWADLERYLGIQ